MKIRFDKNDVQEILKRHVEKIIPGSKVTDIKDKYDDYECIAEIEPQKKEELITT